MYFMGIDMGTSGCKAVVFDENWTPVCQAYREYQLTFPGEGMLELDAELVWDNLCDAIREANSLSPEPVAAFAVSAIGDVIIPVDKNGNSVRRSIIDFDPRGGDEIAEFTQNFGVEKFFETNGMPPLYIGSLAKILWLRKNEPEIYAKVERWATYEDFIIQKMGFAPIASFSEVSRTMLFDVRKKDWADEILQSIPLERSMLPEAKPSGTVIGQLPFNMASELGFTQGACAVVGGHDMVCSAVGAGLDEQCSDVAIDIAGTIEGLIVAMPEVNTCKTMLDNLFPCYLGASGYVTFSVNLTAGCVVRWFRDNIAPDWYAECKASGTTFYKYMQRTMKPDEPGNLIIIPHFAGSGNPFFTANARGTMYGLTLDTQREDMGRAVIEGLAYELRFHLEAYERAGIKLSAIRSVGGGATIDEQLQLKANVTGLKVIKGSVSEASALGAAAYAAVGMGALSNPADAYRKVAEGEKVFEPDMQAHRRFEEKFSTYRDLAYSSNEIDLRTTL